MRLMMISLNWKKAESFIKGAFKTDDLIPEAKGEAVAFRQ